MSLESLLERLKTEAGTEAECGLQDGSDAQHGQRRPLMSDVLATLRTAGVTLEVAGDKLIARPREAVTPELACLIRDNRGVLMAELTEGGTPGVSHEFAARLSTEDLADIAAGDIPVEQVREFERAAIAREAEDLKVILQHDAGLSGAEAELEAARLVVAYARNNGYLWSSLRLALSDYPVLVPDRPGRADSLSLGLAKLAVLKDKRVMRQGEFSGAQEVTP